MTTWRNSSQTTWLREQDFLGLYRLVVLRARVTGAGILAGSPNLLSLRQCEQRARRFRSVFWSAAAYWHSITCQHLLIDGNKRVGSLAAVEFLRLNGWILVAEQEALKRYSLCLARQGTRTRLATIARWLRAHSRSA